MKSNVWTASKQWTVLLPCRISSDIGEDIV